MRYLFLFGLLMAMMGSVQAQITVSGRLVDEKQQPVPYASVALADGRTGTASNEAGEFSLKLSVLPQLLTVLSIGYERKVISVTQAGAMSTPVLLRASAVQLPEVTVRANGEAEALVRRCYAKLLRHRTDVQYGRAFYRQKTQQNGRYREFFDAFYDVKLTPRNMPSWVLGEARYALTKGGMSFSNFSAIVRSLPVFIALGDEPSKTSLPLSPEGLAKFTFVLRQTLREQGRELTVIDFAPRPGTEQATRGSLYIDPRTAALFRVDQELPAAQMFNMPSNLSVQQERATAHIVSDFAAYQDSLTRLASTRATATISLLVQGFSDETSVSSHFFFYEYGPPTTGERYPDTDRLTVDMNLIRRQRYNPLFWRDNAVIKASPIEETIIRDFEGQKVFGKLN
ncbi:carboxypeptidase-like regulatory domain-containing protein [Hymenobacter negativus]|uniref:Carboxypeptidase-like regulatory domain-containing protein n=1 Tax=Hymenobacter negativus TaxID=2795026 RepID=A0ABS3Q9I2_9BACT|nr:carboxypeptidase-like regulatory domain-containing protein [Hymenobacter negativus]MBO2007861.1 carboxypeptidase-like regulatory domain-containing protein [Hymenobacter negativus]